MTHKKSAFMSSAMMVLLGGTAALFLSVVPKTAEAVPSFARQISAPCSTCHTQQPRLNRFGTEFKMNGWQMSSRESISMGGEHTIFESLPVSARFRGNFTSNSGDSGGGNNTIRIPHGEGVNDTGITLFVAGKIADGIGIFGDGDTRVNVNTTIDTPLGNTLIGVIGGHMRPGAGDPFDTVGGGRMMAYTQNRDFVFGDGHDGNDPWQRRGKGANAFAAFGDFYVAAGWWGLEHDEVNNTVSNPDFGGNFNLDENKADMQYYRAVWRPAIGSTNSHVGLHASRISVLEQERYGIDASSQIPLDTGFANMLDIIGVITGGKNGLQDDSSHMGYQVSTAFLLDKWSYGLQLGYYDWTDGAGGESRDATNIGAHVSYLIRPNIRVYTELHQNSDMASRDGVMGNDDAFFTIGFDSDW